MNRNNPNLREKGNWSKIRQEVIERLWKGEELDKAQVGSQYFPRKNNSMQLGGSLIAGIRKKLERFTGKILVCKEGKYRLLYESENGEAIHEMGKRRKRVIHAIDSFTRPAAYLLEKDLKGEMKELVNGGWTQILRTVTRESLPKQEQESLATATEEKK